MIARVASFVVASASFALVACGGTSNVTIPPAETTSTRAPPAGVVEPTPSPGDVKDAGPAPQLDGGTVVPPAPDAGPADGADASLPPDAGDVVGGLLGLTSTCVPASKGTYATDRSASAAVDICKLNGAFFWTADLAVDCDGQTTKECSAATDPTYSSQTAFAQSNGQPLIASELPYVVIPRPGARFDYTKSNVEPGALAIVIYNGQMRYGVFGDEGPTGVIGEASYAMAKSLGINPSPKTGGTDGPVTYFVLTGTAAVVSPIESQAVAAALGPKLALALLANN